MELFEGNSGYTLDNWIGTREHWRLFLEPLVSGLSGLTVVTGDDLHRFLYLAVRQRIHVHFIVSSPALVFRYGDVGGFGEHAFVADREPFCAWFNDGTERRPGAHVGVQIQRCWQGSHFRSPLILVPVCPLLNCDTLLWRQVRSSSATHAGAHLQAWIFDMVRRHSALRVER